MKDNGINITRKCKILLGIIICCMLALIVSFVIQENSKTILVTTNNKQMLSNDTDSNQTECLYLSDINWAKGSTKHGSILRDVASNGSKIAVKIEGAYYTFDKGIWAHATSNLEYDISGYDYNYFMAYVGLNSTATSSSNGVKFTISTSTDGRNWTPVEGPFLALPGAEAKHVIIDITNANYIKLYADSNGGNGYDHSVYADAKLTNTTDDGFGESIGLTIDKYNEIIKEKNESELPIEDYELTLLQRDFVSKVGQYALRRFASESEDNKNVLEWLMGDVENLRLYLLGGTPAGGSYYKSLTELSRLYATYNGDFEITKSLNNKWDDTLTYGDLYKKMAITLSLTHSQSVGLWMQSGNPVNKSDSVTRYQIYKDLHKNGKFIVTRNADGTPNIDITPWFETLKVEEMRFVLNNSIDDEEIVWLNEYIQTNINSHKNQAWRYLTPHPYMAYVYPNYGRAEFHDASWKEKWDEKFNGIFSRYGVTYTSDTGVKTYKVWMNFRNELGTGAVCGGISKTGSNIRTTHGIPATVIGQPGHAALLYYTKDGQGKGYWNIDNDVSGWTLSEKGERMLLGWGNASYSRGYSVVYMVLAQEVINDYENLVKCEEEIMLAKAYEGDLKKQEEIYRKALDIQPINIDAWYGLIDVYNKNTAKTQDDYLALTKELTEKLKCFPLPMYHFSNLIKPKLTNNQAKTEEEIQKNAQCVYEFTLAQTNSLIDATKIANTNNKYYVYQPSVTNKEANYLLKKVDTTIATFSFDGPDAGKIVLSSRFDGSGVRWDYCLKGEAKALEGPIEGSDNWKEIVFTGEEEHKLQLTQEEIESITAGNDIYIHIVGAGYELKNLYKIDITEQSALTKLYANDWENRMIGINMGTEWRYTENENDPWISYSVTSPDLTGNKTVQVRQAATGTKLASPISETYIFTEDPKSATEKYITVSHLSIADYSTQSVDSSRAFYAPNAIDGDINTIWHTDFRYDVRKQEGKPYITIELDEAKYISALEFVQRKYKSNDPDYIKNGIVYVSENGTDDWTEAGRIENCAKNDELKKITFDKSIYGKYVKFEMDTYDIFASLAIVNLYEDTTQKTSNIPTAEIYYSVTERTNQYVIARLVNQSTEITITNNGGKDTYVFTENGEFQFEFVDAKGTSGTAIANVTWIDKNSPTANVEYTLHEDQKLYVILDQISEDVYILDENNNKINYVEVKNGKVVSVAYLDNTGDVYKTAYVNENGTTYQIVYKNTTDVENVAYYVVTLKTTENEMGEVEREEYFDIDGVAVEVDDPDDIEILRDLQQVTRSNPLEFALEEGGDYEFRLLDKANNIAYKSIKVDYIEDNNTILASDITYNITKPTNKNVVATINAYVIDEEGNKNTAIILDHENSNAEEDDEDIDTAINKYTFTENGEFTFRYKAASDAEDAEPIFRARAVSDDNNWDVKEHTAKVYWIDKIKPEANIIYSKEGTTNESVMVTLVNESETIIITNNGNSREYIFEENDKFTFEFEDEAGNKNSVTAKVDWIDKVAPTASVIYSTTDKTNESVTATLTNASEEITIINNNGSDTYTFTQNGEFTFQFRDAAGNVGTALAKVDWIEPEPKVIKGDIDGNGKVTLNDLAKLRLHYIGYEILEGDAIIAADVDGNGRITINDLAALRLKLIESKN